MVHFVAGGFHLVAARDADVESTVSRVTSNKHIATPSGVFELKYFFSRAMTATHGGTFSGTVIRELVNEMIDGETPDAPLSDAQIARMLARQGLVVARRTLTAYRQALRIESVERRRTLVAVRAGGALPTVRDSRRGAGCAGRCATYSARAPSRASMLLSTAGTFSGLRHNSSNPLPSSARSSAVTAMAGISA